MAYLIQNTRTDDFIQDVSGGWPDWTPIRSFAKRFATRVEAELFIAKNQVKGDEPYMKVIKEMKGLKEFVKSKKLTEARVDDRIFPDSGQVGIVSNTGAFGISIFIDSRDHSNTQDGKTKIHWNISTTYDGPYNSEANKYAYVDADEDVEKIIKKHSEEFKNVIKRGIEKLDADIASTLKKLGYK